MNIEELKVGDKYFYNMFGYDNRIKKFEECTTIFELMGNIIVEIEKINKKTFKVVGQNELYKEVPKSWKKMEDYKVSLVQIADTFVDYYRPNVKRAKKAYELLNETSKGIVNKRLEVVARVKAEKEYEYQLKLMKNRLNGVD